MVRRTLGILLALVLASGVMGSDSSAVAPQARRTTGAEHATAEADLAHAGATSSTGKDHTVWPGMTRTGAVLLPSGWSLQPAGRQALLGDLPVQIAVHPGAPILAILHAGYGEHEVMTVDGTSGRVIGRVALPGSFAGLAWSADGKKLFASGGFDDRIYRFDHADGLLTNQA